MCETMTLSPRHQGLVLAETISPQSAGDPLFIATTAIQPLGLVLPLSSDHGQKVSCDHREHGCCLRVLPSLGYLPFSTSSWHPPASGSLLT